MRKQDSIRRARAGFGSGAMSLGVALAVGLAACGGKKNDCHNLPLADAVYGQSTYDGNSVNAGGPVSASSLAAPVGGLVIDPGAHFGYAADTGNNRVLGYELSGGAIPTAAGFVLGQTSLDSNFQGTGTIDGSGACTAYGLSGPQKASISPDGKLVVADTANNRVLIWNSLPTTSNVMPDVIVGQASCNLRASGVSATALNNPTAAVISNNSLIVVDQNNNRVLIWNIAPTTNGAPADLELGQDNSDASGNEDVTGKSGFTKNVIGFYTTNSFGRTFTQFNRPSDVVANSSGLLVSDTGNNRVLFFNQLPSNSSPFSTASSVIGQPSGFSTTNPGASNSLLNAPVGLGSDGSRFFIADTGNNRVLLYNAVPLGQTRGLLATSVFGQEDFNVPHTLPNDDDQNGVAGNQEDDQTNLFATQNTLNGPSGVSISPSGELLISDRGNNRIIQFPSTSGVDGSDTKHCTDYQRIKHD